MTLDNSAILQIASILSAAQLIVKDSVDNIITNLESLSLQYIHNVTQIDIAVLEDFMNQTLPCLYNVSVEYESNPNATGFESDYDMMWVKWYVSKFFPILSLRRFMFSIGHLIKHII